MTFEQIKELLDMGFTPEQITELNKLPIPSSETIPDEGSAGDGSGSPPPEDPAPAITETKASPADPAAAPAAPAPVQDNNADVLREIRELKASIQASNIKTISVDNVKPENTLENVMAEFIRPTYKEKGGNLKCSD